MSHSTASRTGICWFVFLLAISLLTLPLRAADTEHEFTLDLSNSTDKPKTVAVAGSFNGWSKDANPLKNDGQNRWSGKVSLAEGQYQYKFVLDGDKWIDLFAPCDIAGQGRPGGLQLQFLSQPVVGQTFKLGFANPMGLGALYLGPGPVQQPLFSVTQPLFCNTADFFVNPSVSLAISSTAATNVLLPIPADAGLRGFTLVFQAIALQPATCFEATDALHVRL